MNRLIRRNNNSKVIKRDNPKETPRFKLHPSIFERLSRGIKYSGYRYYQSETDDSEKVCIYPKFDKPLREGVTKTYPTKKFVETLLHSEYGEHIEDIYPYCWNKNKTIAGNVCVIVLDENDFSDAEKRYNQIANQCGYYLSCTFKETYNDVPARVYQYEPLFQYDDNIFVGDFLYHITTKQNFEKIKTKGFYPKYQCNVDFNYPGRVYFFNTYNKTEFRKYIIGSEKQNKVFNKKKRKVEDTKEYIIVKIEVDRIDVENTQFFNDPNLEDYSIFTYDNIPPNTIVDFEYFSV